MKKYFYLALSVGLLGSNMAMSSNSGLGEAQAPQLRGYYHSDYEDIREYVMPIYHGVIANSKTIKPDNSYEYCNLALLIHLIAPSLRQIIRADRSDGPDRAKGFVEDLRSIFMDTPLQYHTTLLIELFENRTLSLNNLKDLRRLYPRCYGLMDYQYPSDDNGMRLMIARSFLAGMAKQDRLQADLIYAVEQPSVILDMGIQDASAPLMSEMQ